MRSMVWTMLLGPCAQPHRQHDMHELLVHRLRLPAVRGEWQFRRVEEEGVVVCEQSSTVAPITVDVSEEVRGLQHCIQAWRSRHYRASLCGDAPQIVCLHLSRFRRHHDGAIVKDAQALPDLRIFSAFRCLKTARTFVSDGFPIRSVLQRCTMAQRCIVGTTCPLAVRGENLGY